MSVPLAVVVSGFPRRSETFALHELTALADAGLLRAVFATKRGEPGAPQPGVAPLLPYLSYLPEAPPRDQAAWIAERLPRTGAKAIHAYFAHQPAEVAQITASMARVPFGFSVHARDARKVSPATLAMRARNAACVIACNTDVAAIVGTSSGRVRLIPHGVDLSRFHPSSRPERTTLRLLAVGRLVEKKGFALLLAGLARLTPGIELRIVGDGPERVALESVAARLGILDRVTFAGSRTHADLPQEYADADIVVVPSVVDSTGDRDGLPNVVLEAMATGRPVVATRTGAIANAVVHGVTGLLVDEPEPEALAGAIGLLARQAERRHSMGMAGRAFAEREYELGACTARFVGTLEAAYA